MTKLDYYDIFQTMGIETFVYIFLSSCCKFQMRWDYFSIIKLHCCKVASAHTLAKRNPQHAGISVYECQATDTLLFEQLSHKWMLQKRSIHLTVIISVHLC